MGILQNIISSKTDTKMKKKFVKEIKAGDFVEDVFVLAEKTTSHKKDGNPYINLVLTDKTGSIKGVIWDNLDQIPSETSSGDFVKIKANASEYKGSMQLVVKTMSLFDEKQLDASDFLPATTRDVEQMFKRLLQISSTVENKHLKELLEAFWDDAGFAKEFKSAPAAKAMHHSYLGGLLEHTLSATILADKIAGHYSGVDRDLLITGTILHDIGKIRELDYKIKIDYSDQGRLLSHIVIGVLMLREKIESLKDFPGQAALLLEHMIVSHHGSKEFGSPEPPKTIEAVMLNYIDEIDAKVNGIREFIESEDTQENWTSYHRLLERHFYKKNHMEG
jgi:3'-5' exoribonuclease